MGKSTQCLGSMEGLFGPDRLSEALRGKVREMILSLAEAELSEVLAALPYERKGERRGYRNGKRERWVSTGLGATVIELPRARLTEGDRIRNGKVDSLSVISGAPDRWTVLCWGVTSAERTGGAFGGRFPRFCVVRRFPRVQSRGWWGVFKGCLPNGGSGR